ncbi:MAG TPA: hypothetical protein PKV75_04660 [Desulfobacterales bacterium]|nr:hypothetical protein [Desulfobacterales bacterium]
MQKYKVIIEGNNFAIRLNDKVGKHGFFTTRFVEAKDSKNAETLTMNLIRDELKLTVLNDSSDPPVMYVEEVHEIDDFGDNMVPGSGFTWFKEEKTGN